MKSFKLRDYQLAAEQAIYQAWQDGYKTPCVVLPTGAGKTVLFGKVAADHKGACCLIAHRTELVSQISLAVARYGVRHKIIGPTNTVKQVVTLHNQELGASFYDPNSQVAVAGVDTIIRRDDPWFKAVTLFVIDEAHHVLSSNKWGKACQLFPNAKGLQVTATPCRADKKGLGSHADGLTDIIIEGPSMRELINRGYLTDYRIFAPPCSTLDLNSVPVTASGDFSKTKLTTAVRKSQIIGDVVDHYLKIAPGKLGVTFATDVETATDISNQFNDQGVPAEIVSAKTSPVVRANILQRFKNRKLLQLVNVDLFGEGFDLPAIEVVSMARPTQSYALYVQQFGRALRPMEGKKEAIIIDHVGNVLRHNGPPDIPKKWTLDRGERKSSNGVNDTIPFTACTQCTMVYEKYHTKCPFCGFVPTPTARTKPEFVDGDLCELDAATLAKMRGDVERIDSDFSAVADRMRHAGASNVAINSAAKSHRNRQEAQNNLRSIMAFWGGAKETAGYTVREAQKLFYYRFGVDVMTAQTLGRREATELTEKINGDFVL